MIFHCRYISWKIIYILMLVTHTSYGKVYDCPVEEHPSAVAIVNTVIKTSSCSGAIISPGYVVTVAHCMMLTGDTKQFKVVAGVSKLNKQAAQNGQIRDISRVHYNSVKDESSMFEDIAVISVNEPFTLDKSVYVIPVAEKYDQLSNRCELVGWALSSEAAKTGPVLNSKSKQTIELIPCPIPYNDIFCGESEDFSPDDCVGDTGSPLYYGGVLKGLLMGGACRSPGLHLTFLNVTKYRKWLVEIAIENQSLWRKLHKAWNSSSRMVSSATVLWIFSIL